jgi:diacylglycerol kinase family enzyme
MPAAAGTRACCGLELFMHFIGVLNRDGGSFRTMDLAAFAAEATRIFAEHGRTLECRVVAGEDLLSELDRAARDRRADGLLVGGGDGSASAAAAVAYRLGVPLAVLPAGTMNLFARSLKMPLDLEDALQALAKGTWGDVDIATANGRPFVHQYSVGIHPRLVRVRQSLKYHSRLGKIVATVRAIALAVSRPPLFEAEIATAERTIRQQASNIAVSNNLLGPGHIPHADMLDRGVLGVYVVAPMGTIAMARFCTRVLIGAWKGSPLMSEQAATRVILSFPRRKSSAQAVIDGELVPLESRVEIVIHPGALKVLLPALAVSGVVAA